MGQSEIEGGVVVKLYDKLASSLTDLTFRVRTETHQPTPNAPQLISTDDYVEKCAIFPVEVTMDGELNQVAGTRIIMLHKGAMDWEPKLGTFDIRQGEALEEIFEALSVTRLAKSSLGEAWDFTVEGSICP